MKGFCFVVVLLQASFVISSSNPNWIDVVGEKNTSSLTQSSKTFAGQQKVVQQQSEKPREDVSVPEMKKKIILAEVAAKETAKLMAVASSERDYDKALQHEKELKEMHEKINSLKEELLTHRKQGGRLNSIDVSHVSQEKCYRKVNYRRNLLAPAIVLVKEVIDTLLAEAELHGVNEMTIFADRTGTCPRGTWDFPITDKGSGVGVYFQKDPNPCYDKNPPTNCLMIGDLCQRESEARFHTERDVRKKSVLEKEMAFQAMFSSANISVVASVLTSSLGAVSVAWDALSNGYNAELSGVTDSRVSIHFNLWSPRNVTVIDKQLQGGRLIWTEPKRPKPVHGTHIASEGLTNPTESVISSFAVTGQLQTYSISFMEYFSKYVSCSRVA